MGNHKRYCNTCGKYYEGGKYYCSRKCQPPPMMGKKGAYTKLLDGTSYPPIPDLCHCLKCNEIVYNGHEFIHNHHGVGTHHSEEEIKKMSKPKSIKRTPEHIENHRKSVLGRKDKPETIEKKIIAHTGMHHYQETKDKIGIGNKGIPRTEKQLECFRDSNNPNWKGGIYENPYAPEFNDKVKESIRLRDSYQCQNPECLCTQLESLILWNQSLHAHHIHYDKQNPNPDLVCLCNSCNAKANFNQEHWEQLYTNILKERNLIN
jgi:hypothetical protein